MSEQENQKEIFEYKQQLWKLKNLITNSRENLYDNYTRLLAFISGGAITLSITFLVTLEKKPALYCIFIISLILLAISLITTLLGIEYGLKARYKDIKDLDLEINNSNSDLNKKNSCSDVDYYNAMARNLHKISLWSCIIGIVVLLYFYLHYYYH